MRKIQGPYRVVSTQPNIWEVVEVVGDQYVKLRPAARYAKRPSAYGKCIRLNRKWQQENAPINIS